MSSKHFQSQVPTLAQTGSFGSGSPYLTGFVKAEDGGTSQPYGLMVFFSCASLVPTILSHEDGVLLLVATQEANFQLRGATAVFRVYLRTYRSC